MPVTAKLSREFYDKFGDKITDELVNWLNEVDATYRSELKDLNELNFARFDAKLEQRVAYLDAKVDTVTARLDAKIEAVEKRLEARIDQRAAEVKAQLCGDISELRTETREGFARIEGRVAASTQELKADLLKWMFGAWATLLGAMIALIRLG
jgi:hypothetical protein